MGRNLWRTWSRYYLTERFIKMGIDELSVSPSMVLGVRSRICEME